MPAAVFLVRAPEDIIAGEAPVSWAIGELERALGERAVRLEVRRSIEHVPAGEPALIVAGSGPGGAPLETAPLAAEAFSIAPERTGERAGEREVWLIRGGDVRGLIYALLALAGRVTATPAGSDPLAALRSALPIIERPANRIRSVLRLFASDVEDTGWFHDRAFWRRYLSMLVAQRFNRVHLALGLGYDFPRQVRDASLYFAYPFLLDLPGYEVRVRGLPDEARERNLETLRFIGAEAAGRGLHFQLGLWTHAYELQESPDANYTVQGLAPERHAAYCRDALRRLLQEVPTIGGVTLRIHGESGVPERSYDFWQTVFDGAAGGRRVELDLHAKGIDQRMIDLALATGQPVIVSPKYWAEHLGLPYHQAAIRPTERARPVEGERGRFMALSEAERRFTRYGYADLLRQDRGYDVLWRVWPGTQRLLLWGDPLFAAGYGRAAGFGGAAGMEFFEPLSFKGRKGSGLPGGRHGYADESLAPVEAHGEWEKYAYTYCLWGQLLYRPDGERARWSGPLERTFGAAAGDAEAALSRAGRILPLVTTAHLPSAANYGFWAELPANMPLVDERRPHPYGDTPAPKRFGTVSPLDPALFSTAEECAGELAGRPDGRYSPLEVAAWIDGLADAAMEHLARAERRVPDATAPAWRRWAADVRIQAVVGRFFGHKLRAAVAYAVYQRTGDVQALRDALELYRSARTSWQEAAEHGSVYRDDVTFGPVPFLRGHWADRLPAIDADIDDLAAELARAAPRAGADTAGTASAFWPAALRDPSHRRLVAALDHVPPATYAPGEPLALDFSVSPFPIQPAVERVHVRLRYRHVNQAEEWQALDAAPAEPAGAGDAMRFRATIPASYTDSPYALQYMLEIRQGELAGLWPGFAEDLANQPYIVVTRAA